MLTSAVRDDPSGVLVKLKKEAGEPFRGDEVELRRLDGGDWLAECE